VARERRAPVPEQRTRRLFATSKTIKRRSKEAEEELRTSFRLLKTDELYPAALVLRLFHRRRTMALDERTKELVAVGASITANCGSCLEHHTRKAREAGADRAEIAQAADVGRLVRKGAAGKLDALSARLFQELPVSSSEGCGCP